MTEDQYHSALEQVDELARDDPEPDSIDGLLLDQLVTAIEAYEREHFPDLFAEPGPKGIPP